MVMFSGNKKAKGVMSLQHSCEIITGISEVFSDIDVLLPCSVLKKKEEEEKSHFKMNINISVLQLTYMGMLVCKSPPYKWKICL